MPAYREYSKTTNMSKVNVHYQNAIRTSRTTFVKRNSYLALGLTSTVPNSGDDWIALFNPQGVLAPGGGDAYQASADDLAGVVGITGNADSITIVRPSYQDYGTSITTTIVGADET